MENQPKVDRIKDFFDFHINSILTQENLDQLDEAELISKILESLNSNWESFDV